MAEASYGSLPFAEQSEFFRRKLKLPTTGWTDIYTHEHDWAFVVAGANRDAIVSDFYAAVQKAIDDGGTLDEFRRDFDRIVATHGWDYNGGRDWRSRVIYETNLTTSYAAGRWQQLQAAPFWQYEHADWVTHPRHDHLSWDGLILERENPWWSAHFPPNGWGCQCSVRGLWQSDLTRMGKAGPDQAPETRLVKREIGKRSELGPRIVEVPEGIDPGFEYVPGLARLESAVPPELPDPLPGTRTPGAAPGLPNLRAPDGDELPLPRAFPSSALLEPGLSEEDYARSFLQAFGATIERPVIHRDQLGSALVIGPQLFKDASGQWKADKRGRGVYMPMLAEAVAEPDEIWARLEWHGASGKATVRRRYIARFAVDGRDTPALAVFEIGESGWSGVTVFPPQDKDYLQSIRLGVRLYRRE